MCMDEYINGAKTLVSGKGFGNIQIRLPLTRGNDSSVEAQKTNMGKYLHIDYYTNRSIARQVNILDR